MSDPLDPLMQLPGYLTSGASAIHPGFGRISALLNGMGRPDFSFKTILVGGTNGKGSTASMIAAMLTASGFRTGLHTSPHLVDVRERMRIDGRLPCPTWLERSIAEHADLLADVAPSFFEGALAFSLSCFAAHHVDWAIVEIGLGGRLDAANVLSPEASVITSIGMDHTDLLGDTLSAIALEKAGIMRPSRSVVLGRLPDEARVVMVDEAARLGSLLIEPLSKTELPHSIDKEIMLTSSLRSISDIKLSLSGAHQVDNATVALATIDALSLPVSDTAVREALADIAGYSGLRARHEEIHHDPLIIVDVAHNPQALHATVKSFIAALENSGKGSETTACLLFGCLADKDASTMGFVIHEAFVRAHMKVDVHCFPTNGARGQSAEETANKLSISGLKPIYGQYDVTGTLEQACRKGQPCLVAGSHMLAAKALEWKQAIAK